MKKHIMKNYAIALSIFAGFLAHSEEIRGYYKEVSNDQKGTVTYALVLDKGADIIKSLETFQRELNVASASVTGLGVTKNNVLGFYKFEKQLADGQVVYVPKKDHTDAKVEAPREITNLTCNLSWIVKQIPESEKAFAHCHMSIAGSQDLLDDPLTGAETLRKGHPVVGGHLIAAEVAITAELYVTVSPTKLTKIASDEFGGNLFNLRDLEAKPLKY